jgi:hypothetical protein
MSEPSKKGKPPPVPWWALIGLAALLALPTLVSDEPFPTLTSIGESLWSIGENLWCFARDLAAGFSGPSE